MKILLATAFAALAVGCAAAPKTACNTDAYLIGQRDGRMAKNADEAAAGYAAKCGSFDVARYRDGWDVGFRALRAV
jgi:hypothetical protein